MRFRLSAFCFSVAAPVFTSNGLRSLEDARALRSVHSIAGVITGRALYEGALDLGEALRAAAGRSD